MQKKMDSSFIKSLFFLVCLFVFGIYKNEIYSAENSPQKVLQEADDKSYNPLKIGLFDLAYEVRIKNLTDDLNKTFNIGKLKDVHYKVYWLFPGQVMAEVVGVPDAFPQIKENLLALIYDRLQFVVPQDWSDRLRSYEITLDSSSPIIIHAEDKLNTQMIPNIYITIDGGQIVSIKSIGLGGTQIAKIDKKQTSWSRGLYVVKSVDAEMEQGNNGKTIVNTEIDYTFEGGYGFPSKMLINTIQKGIKFEEKRDMDAKTKAMMKKLSQDISTITEIAFTNYSVNKNIAKKFFDQRNENINNFLKAKKK